MRSAGWSRRGGTPRYQSDVPSQQVEQKRAAEVLQPDIQQFGKFREKLRNSNVRHLGEQNWSPLNDTDVQRVRMANRTQRIVAANVPQKIMDQNMHRSEFTIGNTTGVLLLYNFGSPSIPGAGLPIAVNGKDGRRGFTCPIDEIWVTSSIAGALVTAYESVQAFP